ncbi:MAG: MBL fold metallo-hydrolase [Deferrisomatales bacterium]|nr:MBL fold metallo-hydrolase [Deferrisomatales bacterium]
MVPLEGTEVLTVGGYAFQCVPTPGHTEGHMCLFEPTTRTLFSGDHILGDITPNIQGWASNRNPLVEYLNSLDVSAARDVALVLPGHRQPFSNHGERIEQLQAHHRHRLDEALAALDGAGKTAYAAAPLLRWDYDVKDWDRWPLAQRWFATGEALAHLRWLVHAGLVSEECETGRVLYRKG